MPVTRERVDPQRDHDDLGLVHRRWILPDDLRRPIALPAVARLWRGLLDLGVLDGNAEVHIERRKADGGLEAVDLPAAASAGALLAGSAGAQLATQVVWTDEEGRRDPYALDGEADPAGFRDYTLYAMAGDGLLLPIPPLAITCAACGEQAPFEAPRFGEGALLSPARACPRCGAASDPGRDRAHLRNGAVFLLEEVACRAALSIELPAAPSSEELPDARIAELLQQCFGATDELADDGVPPA